MSLDKDHLVVGWLWSIGLLCLALPYFWWPREFSWKLLFHAVFFIYVLSLVLKNLNEGGVFDHRRSAARGYLATIAYSVVIFAGALVYSSFIK